MILFLKKTSHKKIKIITIYFLNDVKFEDSSKCKEFFLINLTIGRLSSFIQITIRLKFFSFNRKNNILRHVF